MLLPTFEVHTQTNVSLYSLLNGHTLTNEVPGIANHDPFGFTSLFPYYRKPEAPRQIIVMAYNDEDNCRVKSALARERGVTERKMFGSVGFMLNNNLLLGVGDNKYHSMMVRVGKDEYEQCLRRPGAKPAIMRVRKMKGYVFLEDEAFESDEDLLYWIELALAENRRR